jgi:heat shock protein HslJ
MPQLRVLAAAAVVVLLLAGCTSGDDRPTTPDPRLFGGWQLTSGTDAQGLMPLSFSDISLTISASTAAHGRGACNDYSGRIVGSIGAVFVAKAAMSQFTQCTASALNELDARYLDDLIAVRFAAVRTDRLTLSSRFATLVFERAGRIPVDSIVNTVWVAQSLSALGLNTAFEKHPYNVTLLLSQNGRFLISTACPAITGRWSEDAGEIVFSDVTGLHAPCSDVDTTHRFEVYDVLGNGFTVDQRAHTLFVANPRQRKSLLFVG